MSGVAVSRAPIAVALRPIGLAEVPRLLEGGLRRRDWHPEYPMTNTLIGLRMLLTTHRALGWTGSTVPRWWLHHIVVRDGAAGGQVVGDIGFHGPPPEGSATVELGYDVVPAMQRRGIATAACRQLLAVAWADGAASVEAETEADNIASQRVLAAAGFVSVGGGHWRITRPDPRSGR